MKLKHPLSLTNHRQIAADLKAATQALDAANMWLRELPGTHRARKRHSEAARMVAATIGHMRQQLKDDGHVDAWLSGEIYGTEF